MRKLRTANTVELQQMTLCPENFEELRNIIRALRVRRDARMEAGSLAMRTVFQFVVMELGLTPAEASHVHFQSLRRLEEFIDDLGREHVEPGQIRESLG